MIISSFVRPCSHPGMTANCWSSSALVIPMFMNTGSRADRDERLEHGTQFRLARRLGLVDLTLTAGSGCTGRLDV